MVVLPFVPVTPTTTRCSEGLPWKLAASGAIAARVSATTSCVARFVSMAMGWSTSKVLAPASTAAPANV